MGGDAVPRSAAAGRTSSRGSGGGGGAQPPHPPEIEPVMNSWVSTSLDRLKHELHSFMQAQAHAGGAGTESVVSYLRSEIGRYDAKGAGGGRGESAAAAVAQAAAAAMAAAPPTTPPRSSRSEHHSPSPVARNMSPSFVFTKPEFSPVRERFVRAEQLQLQQQQASVGAATEAAAAAAAASAAATSRHRSSGTGDALPAAAAVAARGRVDAVLPVQIGAAFRRLSPIRSSASAYSSQHLHSMLGTPERDRDHRRRSTAADAAPVVRRDDPPRGGGVPQLRGRVASQAEHRHTFELHAHSGAAGGAAAAGRGSRLHPFSPPSSFDADADGEACPPMPELRGGCGAAGGGGGGDGFPQQPTRGTSPQPAHPAGSHRQASLSGGDEGPVTGCDAHPQHPAHRGGTKSSSVPPEPHGDALPSRARKEGRHSGGSGGGGGGSGSSRPISVSPPRVPEPERPPQRHSRPDRRSAEPAKAVAKPAAATAPAATATAGPASVAAAVSAAAASGRGGERSKPKGGAATARAGARSSSPVKRRALHAHGVRGEGAGGIALPQPQQQQQQQQSPDTTVQGVYSYERRTSAAASSSPAQKKKKKPQTTQPQHSFDGDDNAPAPVTPPQRAAAASAHHGVDATTAAARAHSRPTAKGEAGGGLPTSPQPAPQLVRWTHGGSFDDGDDDGDSEDADADLLHLSHRSCATLVDAADEAMLHADGADTDPQPAQEAPTPHASPQHAAASAARRGGPAAASAKRTLSSSRDAAKRQAAAAAAAAAKTKPKPRTTSADSARSAASTAAALRRQQRHGSPGAPVRPTAVAAAAQEAQKRREQQQQRRVDSAAAAAARRRSATAAGGARQSSRQLEALLLQSLDAPSIHAEAHRRSAADTTATTVAATRRSATSLRTRPGGGGGSSTAARGAATEDYDDDADELIGGQSVEAYVAQQLRRSGGGVGGVTTTTAAAAPAGQQGRHAAAGRRGSGRRSLSSVQPAGVGFGSAVPRTALSAEARPDPAEEAAEAAARRRQARRGSSVGSRRAEGADSFEPPRWGLLKKGQALAELALGPGHRGSAAPQAHDTSGVSQGGHGSQRCPYEVSMHLLREHLNDQEARYEHMQRRRDAGQIMTLDEYRSLRPLDAPSFHAWSAASFDTLACMLEEMSAGDWESPAVKWDFFVFMKRVRKRLRVVREAKAQEFHGPRFFRTATGRKYYV